jgi:asparagine synthase (glutamine-hydrolysing)
VPLPDRLQSYNYFSRFAPQSILHPQLLAAVNLARPLEQLRSTWQAAGDADTVDRMLFLDWKFTLADNDLRKVGRMCELAGMSVRYPWLDDRVVALSMRLPGSWKVRGRELRWFVKRALRGFLPEEVIHKPKHGFGLPFGVWMRTHDRLRQLAGDSLASLRRRDLVRPDYIDELQRLHREEHAPYFGEFIWVLMMLEQWLAAHENTASLPLAAAGQRHAQVSNA